MHAHEIVLRRTSGSDAPIGRHGDPPRGRSALPEHRSAELLSDGEGEPDGRVTLVGWAFVEEENGERDVIGLVLHRRSDARRRLIHAV